MAFGYIIFALVLGLRLASGSALPINDVVVPDKNLYNGRDGTGGSESSCTRLTLDQAKKLPGWSKIVQYAQDTYGPDDGATSIVLNPDFYPDYPAIVCVDQKPISISTQGTPNCSQSNSAIEGTINGTTGTMTLSQVQGYSNTASWSVTQASSLAQGITLTGTFALPGILSVSGGGVTTATFSNSLSQGFTTNFNNQATETITINTVAGKTCAGNLTTTICTVSGTGTVQYVASGYVWFYYNQQHASKLNPEDGLHYRWNVNIEEVIQNVDDRSSSMEFTGVMQMNNKANFSAGCS